MRHNVAKMKMDPNLTPTIIMLILGVSTFILTMLLPALLELKRPRDAGPRAIMDNVSAIQSQMGETILIANVEEEQGFDQALVEKIADIIAVLPSLEV